MFIYVIAKFRKYKLPMSCIIPFPKRNDPSSVLEFAPGRHVLAVYPGTTALYKATVENTPLKVTILFILFDIQILKSNHHTLHPDVILLYLYYNFYKYFLFSELELTNIVL